MIHLNHAAPAMETMTISIAPYLIYEQPSISSAMDATATNHQNILATSGSPAAHTVMAIILTDSISLI